MDRPPRLCPVGVAFTDGEPSAGLLLAGGSRAIAWSAAFVGYFVDLNETTLHRFYRDRLMEAFMPDIDEDAVPIE